jgi:transcriptional regulator with XRE-family HTH domain
MPEEAVNYLSTLDAPTPERVKVAEETKRLREARGLSLRQLTHLANYASPHKVGEIENPDKPVPSLGLIAAVDNALNADGRLIELRKRAYDAHMKRRDALKKLTAGTAAVALPTDVLDTTQEILERIILEQVDYVGSGVVDELERLAARSIADYDVKHSAVMALDVTRWNHRISKLLLGKQYPSELKRLQAVGCQFSGVLSKISGDLGERDLARVYALASVSWIS